MLITISVSSLILIPAIAVIEHRTGATWNQHRTGARMAQFVLAIEKFGVEGERECVEDKSRRVSF